MNVLLAIFNLIPLPPLDGSWVASWGLPRPIAERYDRVVEPYGQWILLVLFATGAARPRHVALHPGVVELPAPARRSRH